MMPTPRPRSSDLAPTRSIRARRWLMVARVVVGIESLAPRLVRLGALWVLVVTAGWLGLGATLSPWSLGMAQFLILALSGAILLRDLEGWRWPGPRQALRRLQRDSALSHRPLETLHDRPASSAPGLDVVWERHQNIARERIGTLHLRGPHLGRILRQADPRGLRHGLALVLLVAAMAAWGQWPQRLRDMVIPRELGVASAQLQAQLVPPGYSGLSPIVLRPDQRGVLVAPADSTLDVSVLADHGARPSLDMPGGGFLPMPGAPDQGYRLRLPVLESGTAQLNQGARVLGQWSLQIMAKTPPVISWITPPQITPSLSMQIEAKVSDRWGLAQIQAVVSDVEGDVNRPAVTLDLPRPPTLHGGDQSIGAFHDLTGTTLAGRKVRVVLRATNTAGLVGESLPAEITLPERVFNHPLAQALASLRARLLTKGESERAMAANALVGLSTQPERYGRDKAIGLALRAAGMRLWLNRTPRALVQAAGILWPVAVRLEEGASGQSRQRLGAAQEALQRALDNPQDIQAMQRAFEELEQALGEHLRVMAAEWAARGALPADTLPPAAAVITPQQLSSMLTDAWLRARSGDHDGAMRRLQELRQMLDQLSLGEPSSDASASRPLPRWVPELGKLVQDQDDLNRRTDSALRAAHSGADMKNHDRIARGELAREQESLRGRLGDVLAQVMRDVGKDSSVPDSLGQAERAMKAAGDLLTDQDAAGAQAAQGVAVQALREGLDHLRTQASATENGGQQRDPNQMGGGRDPLGRLRHGLGAGSDGAGRIPDSSAVHRLRPWIEELRRRASDPARAPEERDYLNRLLSPF
ncbi:MAG: DUF4175 family protein [Alphaproteobacteria bacterium]|nr:MAG: DUF4175 family protein [Alphaproteobacteria bacterium]